MEGEGKAFYRGMCPNCEGRIRDSRLRIRNPCFSCLKKSLEISGSYFSLLESVREKLLAEGKLKKWEDIYSVEKNVAEVERFFKRASGFEFWSAQRTWVKRIIKGRSFSIIAPTGMGKSTFGAFMSLWHFTKGKKSYIIVPTTPLVVQTHRKLVDMAEKAGVSPKIAYYHGRMKKKEKEEMMKIIDEGSYDILITSAQWLSRNFEKLEGRRFDFIFVDDVDAFLKTSKNIDRSLILLGFTQEIIDRAWEAIRLRKQMAKYLNGRSKDREEKLRELNTELKKVQEEIDDFKSSRNIGTLIIASATGSARGDRIKLYRELLGFEVGSGRSALRNVVDSYIDDFTDTASTVESLLRRLGKGGLVFVPTDQGLDFAGRLVSYLKERGLRVELASSKNGKGIEKFERGEVDYLIGSATYYGTLVRGLDLPHIIRYAVFTGVPKFRFSIDLENPTIFRVLGLLSEVMPFLSDDDRREAEKKHSHLRRLIRNIPQFELMKIEEAMSEGKDIESGFHNHVLNVFRDVVQFLRDVLRKDEVLKRMADDPFLSLKKEGGKWIIELPDVRTYIQATGRTSRLFAGGITTGLSVLLVDNKKVFNGLVRQMRWRFMEFKMVPFREIDLDDLMKRIDEDREKVKLVMEGKISTKVKDLVKAALMVVESPNKARTIAGFFGHPSKRRIGDLVAYEVSVGDMMLTILASGGHLFDLVSEEGYYGVLIGADSFTPVYGTIKRCRDCGYQFVDPDSRICPVCGSSNVHDAMDNVEAMRDIAQEVDEVLIATDPDTEGEKIAWDIRNVLSPYAPVIKRVEFHEVTRPAILRAIKEARDINENRVNAQLVRRIEDRWIGFELSQELQRVFENRNLSAGRVQTPVLGWIIQRYSEFSESETRFVSLKLSNGLQITVDVGNVDKKSVPEIREVKVLDVRRENRELQPSPPYTTDEMLKDASMFLKLSAAETMRLAQDLFEAGLTTYHRTDSTHVSNTGIEVAREYITQEIGEEYFRARPWGEEGAHEAIRPTRPIDTGRLIQLVRDGVIQLSRNLTRNHYRLYDMIFRRFMTSQMIPAEIVYEEARIDTGIGEAKVEGYVDIVKDGWTRLRSPFLKKIPPLEKGQVVGVEETKTWKAPKIPLYTQGDIISLMKQRGIGRPSTYAKIVSTLLKRGYVFETKGKKKLVPTDRGMKVYHYLVQRYKPLVNEDRTRELERKMDLIEEGKLNYMDVLKELYDEIRTYSKTRLS